GGGVVAVELAQAYATLGARVTVLETLERLISREEPFASELLQRALAEQGVRIELGVKASQVRRGDGDTDGASQVTLELEDGRSFSAEQLLVAVGREPR